MTRSTSIFALLLTAILALSSACNRTEELPITLSESEAVEIIQASLHSQAGGLTTNIEDLVTALLEAVASGELCDTAYQENLEQDFSGSNLEASYNAILSYTLRCNSLGIPQSADAGLTTSSQYQTTRISSDDSGSFSGTVDGLEPALSTVQLNAVYRQVGSQDLRFAEQKDINSTLFLDLLNLDIRKTTRAIEAGEGTFTFSGSSTDESFSYAGSLVFTGNNTATLTINGTSYPLEWD